MKRGSKQAAPRPLQFGLRSVIVNQTIVIRLRKQGLLRLTQVLVSARTAGTGADVFECTFIEQEVKTTKMMNNKQLMVENFMVFSWIVEILILLSLCFAVFIGIDE